MHASPRLTYVNSTMPTQPLASAFGREHLLTATEVAAILRVKRTTALDYMRRGLIPAFKLGRRWYSLRPQLEAHLATATTPPPP